MADRSLVRGEGTTVGCQWSESSFSWVSAPMFPPLRSVSCTPPPVSLQKVHVLPQTVLYIADAETFSGHEECHEQKKGKAWT